MRAVLIVILFALMFVGFLPLLLWSGPAQRLRGGPRSIGHFGGGFGSFGSGASGSALGGFRGFGGGVSGGGGVSRGF